AACGCTSDASCGRICEGDADCPTPQRCAPFGRCAAASACSSSGQCAEGFECQADSGPTLDGTCAELSCGGGDDDVCGAGEVALAPACSNGERCSLLENGCATGYSCQPGLGLLVCTEPSECGRSSVDTLDCSPDTVDGSGRCARVTRQSEAECPGTTLCIGPADARHCGRPGAGAKGAACSDYRDCATGYCFAENSCAIPCRTTSECAPGEYCQNVLPTSLP